MKRTGLARLSILLFASFILFNTAFAEVVASPAKTLGKTYNGFISIYEDTMENFRQETDIGVIEKSNPIELSLTQRCAAVLYMSGDEINTILHVGISDGNVISDFEVKASMCATILSVDPSVGTDIVVELLDTIISDKKSNTDFCTYTYYTDDSNGALVLEICPK